MSLTECDNPYAAGSVIDPDQRHWTDGDIEFTEQEIRVSGDVRLPEICLRTGEVIGLVRRRRVVLALTVRAFCRCAPFLIAATFVRVFPGLWFDRVINGNAMLVFLIIAAVILCYSSERLVVTWYLSDRYVRSLVRRRRYVIVMGGLAMAATWMTAYLLSSSAWLAASMLTVYVTVCAFCSQCEPRLRAVRSGDGQYRLSGFRRAFFETWVSSR